MVLTNFLETARNNSSYFKYMEMIIEFVFKITSRFEHIRNWFYTNKQHWVWLIDWIKEFKYAPNPMAQNVNIRLFKRRGNNNFMQGNNNYKQESNRGTALYYYRMKKITALNDQ